MGLCFVALPGVSGSGNQMVGERVHSPSWAVHLITSLVLAPQFSGSAGRPPCQVCHVSPLGSWSLIVILLVDVNRPGSQEDFVSNWEPAHSVVQDAISGAEIAPHLLVLAIACLPLCLWQGEGPICRRLALLWYSRHPLFCEQARLCLRAFPGKFLSLSLFFFSL